MLKKEEIIGSDSKVLYLTLMKKYFDAILEGKKKIEYRKIKSYWKNRLFNKNGSFRHFDFIFFRNGYSKECRKMIVEYRGLRVKEEYELLLWDVLWFGK